jgi:hypothetical protein
MCASFKKASGPFWDLFGFDGIGFPCCEVQRDELLPPAPNVAMVILEQGSLSAYQMEDKLTDLVEEDEEWRVEKLNDTDFSMFFPSKESLRVAILGGGLTLLSSKLHVIVTTSSEDPAAVEHLSEVWVKLYDVPPPTGRLCAS